MALNPLAIKKMLEENFTDATFVNITDNYGDGYHLELEIHSKNLSSIKPIEAHKQIYSVLGSLMEEIHALTIIIK